MFGYLQNRSDFFIKTDVWIFCIRIGFGCVKD